MRTRRSSGKEIGVCLKGRTEINPVLPQSYSAKIYIAVAVRRTKAPAPPFEQLNLERMREAADSVQLTDRLKQDVRLQSNKHTGSMMNPAN